MKNLLKYVFIYLVIALYYCLGDSLPSLSKNKPSAERYNFFDSELLKAIGNEKSGNLVISPVGIKILLGIILEGADGNTAEQLRKILRLPQNMAQVREEFDAWLSLIKSVNKHSYLKISNVLFVAKKYSIRKGYRKVLKKHYEAAVTPVKFHNRKETSNMINNWVAEKTNHFVTKLIEDSQLNSDAQMILLNALYFKGLWLNPFEKDLNSMRCFHTLDEGCIKTCMLSATGNFKYGYVDQLDSQAIQIPYEGGKYFMLILLPNLKENISQLTHDLLHVSLNSILQELQEEEILVRLPRFEISYSEDVSDYLMQLQVTEAFRQNANFSKMFQTQSEKASLGHIFHSAKISVHETGTEAAAAAGASFRPLMGGVTSSFNIQHPFLFFIMDSVMNSVIFAGRFMKPEVPDPVFCSPDMKSPLQEKKPKIKEQINFLFESNLQKVKVEKLTDTSKLNSKVSSIIFPKDTPINKVQKLSYASPVPVRQTSSTISNHHTMSTVHLAKHFITSNVTETRKIATVSSTGTTTQPQKSLELQANTRSPFLKPSMITSIVTKPSLTSKTSRNPLKASLIHFPTEKSKTIQMPSSVQEPLQQGSKSPEKPVLIEGKAPFMYYPFSENLKVVYAGIEKTTTSKSTVDLKKIPITNPFVFRDEELDKRWEHLKGHISNPENWRHRVLYFI